MDYFITLVAAENDLSAQDIEALGLQPDRYGDYQADPDWLAPGKAVDLRITEKPGTSALDAFRRKLADRRIDIFVTAGDSRRKKLLLADMDSTIVTGETLDEIAAQAGIGEQIAAITSRAMAGEIDFEGALRERVGLLKAQPSSLLEDVLAQVELSSGALSLVRSMAAQGATCVLVSGGFTCFTGPIARKAGFHHHHGNTLCIEGDQLAGSVTDPILGREAKRSFLEHYAQKLGYRLEETLAVGDGANDLAMLEAAGLGVGYRPKPLLREKLGNLLLYNDLSAILYAQGYRTEEIIAG